MLRRTTRRPRARPRQRSTSRSTRSRASGSLRRSRIPETRRNSQMNASQAAWRGKVGALLLATAMLLPIVALGATKWGADYFPDVVLTTQDGAQVHFYEDLVKGKSVAINAIYTSCTDECPLETARMAQVQRLLGDRMGKD